MNYSRYYYILHYYTDSLPLLSIQFYQISPKRAYGIFCRDYSAQVCLKKTWLVFPFSANFGEVCGWKVLFILLNFHPTCDQSFPFFGMTISSVQLPIKHFVHNLTEKSSIKYYTVALLIKKNYCPIQMNKLTCHPKRDLMAHSWIVN